MAHLPVPVTSFLRDCMDAVMAHPNAQSYHRMFEASVFSAFAISDTSCETLIRIALAAMICGKRIDAADGAQRCLLQ